MYYGRYSLKYSYLILLYAVLTPYSGVARGAGEGSCPRAPPRGGRQNPDKEFFKIYIRRNKKNKRKM